ncbi:platelet factor 4-like [Lutra lutra]|uniref:platelet factor 4-like n=1 Tax=Lutra lutra TaxID=9657 RepID=UPI001FD1BA22|nr:platelet factor 4-like [Lutra lutra]
MVTTEKSMVTCDKGKTSGQGLALPRSIPASPFSNPSFRTLGIKWAWRVLGATGLHKPQPRLPYTLGFCLYLLDMSVGARSCAPSPWLGPGLLLLGLLLLPAVVALPTVDLEGGEEDLRCVCMKTTSLVRPKHISSLEVIGVSGYCPTPQMIASLKDGRKICLDPNAPVYKKIIRKLLKS